MDENKINSTENCELDDDDLDAVSGGFFGFGKKKKDEPITFKCPFCGSNVEQEPISTDMPSAWGYCRSSSCGGRAVYK